MTAFETLRGAFPNYPKWEINWDQIENSCLSRSVARMKAAPQNPRFHGEGDVWTHTRMVCETLASMRSFQELSQNKRDILFTAALLHDIGKPGCTVFENNEIVSPGHAAAGAKKARQLLWSSLGLCGTVDRMRFRETVCTLIHFHSAVPWIVEHERWAYRLRKIGSFGELLPDFNVRLLCLLEEADMMGRIASDAQEMAEMIRYTAELAQQASCLENPYPFPDHHTRYNYLLGRKIQPDYPFYNDTWGEVILLCGLPGTGKDTFIKAHFPDMPMISLDEIRKETGVSPTDPQGKVADTALARARELLRKKRSFVWNATNVSRFQREKPLTLFRIYNASTRIFYLETDPEQQMQRNRSRISAVPDAVIQDLIGKTEPPALWEAKEVSWLTV